MSSSVSKFQPPQAISKFSKDCNKHQTSEICMEIATAFQKDLKTVTGKDINKEIENVKNMYNSFLGKYIDYLNIKAKINNYEHITISKFNRCTFFDYSFLDDVITNEHNLVKNIDNVKKVISIFDNYKKFTKEDMALYSVYNKFLYEDLFASIAPYYQLLTTELLNYQSMRKELVKNLTNNIDSLNEDVRIIKGIDTSLNEISSDEYRTLSKLNPTIKFNRQLENPNKTIILDLIKNIITEYENKCDINYITLINNSLKYNIDFKLLLEEYGTKRCEINKKYIAYLKDKSQVSERTIRTFSTVRKNVRTVNARNTRRVNASVANVTKSRKGSKMAGIPILLPADKYERIVEDSKKISNDVDELLRDLAEKLGIDLDSL